MAYVYLKIGREKSLLRRHPWIFSGAIGKIEGVSQSGETIIVQSSDKTFLARGAYSPRSQISIRVWSFDPNEEISSDFFRFRLERAIKTRHVLLKPALLTAYRLVNSESDGLPGVIVDRYGDFLVCQFLSAGAEYWKKEIIVQLNDLIPNSGIYERSDVEVREKEGLLPCTGVLSGQTPPDVLEICEGFLRFLVDVKQGHKTGFYLDQRDSRAAVAKYAKDAEVLNCFAYTGGFGIWALKGGASRVTNIDSSSSALELARRNIEINGLDPEKVENVGGDVFRILRQYRDSQRQFDLIILDPPKFAESRIQLDRACRGYKDINLLAFKLLRAGGILFTFSCSGLVSMELFQKIVADAAIDAGREGIIIQRLSQSFDHPIALNFPESYYLKGLVCRVS